MHPTCMGEQLIMKYTITAQSAQSTSICPKGAINSEGSETKLHMCIKLNFTKGIMVTEEDIVANTQRSCDFLVLS